MTSIAKVQSGIPSLPDNRESSLSARFKAGHRLALICSLLALLLPLGCGRSKKPAPSDNKAGVTAKANLATPIPCDRAHTELVEHDGKDGVDVICHDRTGRHAVALRKPDRSFIDSPGWWPSDKSGWCDPAHLKSGDYNGDLKIDMSCHRDDGRHQVALSNGDGTFTVKSWWPSEPGKETGWCDPGHLKFGFYNEDDKLDMSCHSQDGKHIVAFSNGDGTFTLKSWWPSEPGKGPGWCDPAHLKIGDFNYRTRHTIDMSCHTDDGKHVIAFNKGDGTFAPKAWWPSDPGKGPGWCDPGHLRYGAFTADRDALDMSCHTDDGDHLIASNNADGTFSPRAWWPSAPNGGASWCDPTSLSMGRIAGDKTNRFHLFCHSKDGKHLLALNNGDGSFTPKGWWPSQPGKDAGWCDPAHLDLDNSDRRSADMTCRADDGRVLVATAQLDGSFVGSAAHSPKWPQ